MEVDFLAIDFEIANNAMSSACSLGLVFVKDNQIVEEKYFLIQPPSLTFLDETTKIHGLTVEDVRNERKFYEIWEEIKHHFNGTTIIAHNAQFDMSVLHSCLKEYSLEVPEFEYICSIPLSAKACTEKVGNSLVERLSHFNIELENHHNALHDARACAELITTCVTVKNKKSLQAYCKTYRSIPIKKFSELKPQTFFKQPRKKKTFTKVVISEISANVQSFNEDHPFFGKNIVFTGELKLDRKEAMQKVVNAGGTIKSGVSGKTHYLIVGKQDKTIVGANGISTKEEKAYALIEKGTAIKVIGEEEFVELLGS